MGYRAFRCNLSDIYRSEDGMAGLADEVIYRIPGVPHEFKADVNDLCPNCSVPAIDFLDKTSGKVRWVWHDETCLSADDDVKIKPRVLNRQR